MFSVSHASTKGPCDGGGGGGGGQKASCLVAKQAVEFPQVLASTIYTRRMLGIETASRACKNQKVKGQKLTTHFCLRAFRLKT